MIVQYYNENFVQRLFGEDLELVPGTSDIYELDLAFGELHTLSRKELIERAAMFGRVDGQETYHYKICSSAPLQVDPSSTIRRKSFFVQYQFKTGYATHGLFPYRGKFHPQLIKAIMNIIQMPRGGTVLDAMTGSGTVNVESSIIGVNSIGLEMSPFCVLMARAKVSMLDVDADKLDEYSKDIPSLFDRYVKKNATKELSHFYTTEQSSPSTLSLDDRFDELFLLAYLDAVGYARRREKQSVEKLFPVVVHRYLQAIRNFASVRDELGLELGKAEIRLSDARKLDLKDSSVDGIITSPPYSFAIDYVENDRPQLEYLGANPEILKSKMIGLAGGKSREQRVKYYFQDMKKVITEYHRVLKPGRCCVIVIGSNEIQTGGIRHEVEFEKFGKEHGLRLFKKLIRPITGLGNVMRDEYVLFFTKE